MPSDRTQLNSELRLTTSAAIVLAGLAALAGALVLTLATGCAVAVRRMTAPARGPVGAPPPGLEARAVKIAAEDGPRLAAWFAPGRAGRGAVLLVHGIRSDRRALSSRMTLLARAGFAVLAMDLRAHGESEGRAITFGRDEALDVAAGVRWLGTACPGERIGTVGISLGGAAAALASRRVAIDALVLESVFPDLHGAIANRVRGVTGPLHAVVTPALVAMGAGMTGIRPGELRPIVALSGFRGPVLLISGTEDRHTTIAETRRLHAVVDARRAELWEVEGAGHVDLAVAGGIDYERRILAFLGRHLQRDAPCA